MSSGHVDERATYPIYHETSTPMRQKPDPTIGNLGNDISDDDDAISGIDITKSLYHLRLHGFDVIAKDHQANGSTLSPARIACVTPAVSPVHDAYSYRKRPSHLPQGSITPQISSRPLSPTFLEMTPTRPRRLTSVPPRNEHCDKGMSDLAISSKPKRNIDKIDQPNMDTISPSPSQKITSEVLQRTLPTTIADGEDEFEVMLESSVSSDECDEYCLRNESSILDSPQSLPSYTQIENKDDEDSCDDGANTISPQTPAHFNFCGIPTWCDTTTTNSTNRHLFLDDCSMANTFQLQHRSASEWFVCPTPTMGCCINTLNDADMSVDHSGSRQIVQTMLQNHICMSLGDSIESLCWQKSATSVIPKTPNGSVHLNSSTPLPTIGEDSKRMKTKHRRSSTLPAHRRVDEFASLQYNLHPFDSVPLEPLHNRNTKPHRLTKSQSFQHTSKYQNPQRNTVSSKGKIYPQSDVGLVSTDWECGVLDFALAFESTKEIIVTGNHQNTESIVPQLINVKSLGKNDGGYESDPEIFCRKVKSERLKNEDPKSLPSPPSNTLHEFLNERNTFIWHTCNSKSIAVHVWIELGQQLYDSLLLPKMCWKPILSPSNSSSNETKQTSIVGGTFSSMELLSICRIRQVVNGDREQYPFAQTQRLFSIQSTVDSYDSTIALGGECPTEQQHHNIILEARSIADRIRFTNLLKLTVSTLAAKFITNDPNTLTMFFHNPTISDYVA